MSHDCVDSSPGQGQRYPEDTLGQGCLFCEGSRESPFPFFQLQEAAFLGSWSLPPASKPAMAGAVFILSHPSDTDSDFHI